MGIDRSKGEAVPANGNTSIYLAMFNYTELCERAAFLSRSKRKLDRIEHRIILREIHSRARAMNGGRA